jgi:hypothetical protein
MAGRAPTRDYLYVSTYEVERLAATSAGPTSLADAPRETLATALDEVESAVRLAQPVKRLSDADLAVGDWFESHRVRMAYGVQAARRSADADAAVFVGRIDERVAGDESSLLLGGSADHLRAWRPTEADDVSGDMSYPSALFALLGSLAARNASDPSARSERSEAGFSGGDRRIPSHRQAGTRGEQAREEQWLAVGYPIEQVLSAFGQRGYFPLSFLAHVVKIVNFESHGLPGRWIVGAPLWVALQVPE